MKSVSAAVYGADPELGATVFRRPTGELVEDSTFVRSDTVNVDIRTGFPGDPRIVYIFATNEGLGWLAERFAELETGEVERTSLRDFANVRGEVDVEFRLSGRSRYAAGIRIEESSGDQLHRVICSIDRDGWNHLSEMARQLQFEGSLCFIECDEHDQSNVMIEPRDPLPREDA